MFFFSKICVFLYMYLYVHCFFSICLTASTRSASLGFAQYIFINMATSLLLMSDLRIISFNTQGLQGINKRIDVLEYLKDKNFHIYCLQDTHFTKDNVDKTKVQWGKGYVMSTFRPNARGVAILFGKDIELSIHIQVIDEGGNFIILNITIFKQRLTLVNLYGPNEDDPMFFSKSSKPY